MSAYAIGHRLEPFVDRTLVADMVNTRLELLRPVSAGRVFTFDRPWEGPLCGYGTVLRDGNRFLLYYRGMPVSANDKNHAQCTCVALSDDGIHWERPELSFHEVAGCARNNVILFGKGDVEHNFAPFIDENPASDPAVRFKGVGGHCDSGLFLYGSADGIEWHPLQDGPMLPPKPPEVKNWWYDSQNVVFWSTVEECYVCYFRLTDVYRSVARRTSPDLVHWSDLELMEYGDTVREQLYTNQTHPYVRAPHISLAICARFMPGRQVLSDEVGDELGFLKDPSGTGYWHDCSDAVFMTTRGGNHYDRTFMEAYIRPGPDPANWGSRCNYPTRGVIETAADELSFYVDRHNAQPGKFLERFTLRPDGFAAVRAPYAGGSFTTVPLVLPEGELVLNVATAAVGQVRVEAQDVGGHPLPGLTLADCGTIIGDDLSRPVCWGDPAALAARVGQPVRLHFEMKDADLFSIQFRPGS